MPPCLALSTEELRIKGKVEQSRVRSSALTYTSMYELLKGEPSGRPRLRSLNVRYIYFQANTFVKRIKPFFPKTVGLMESCLSSPAQSAGAVRSELHQDAM